jgi:Domain of unknown function (DUF4396)
MRNLSMGEAIKVDTLSLASFQVGFSDGADALGVLPDRTHTPRPARLLVLDAGRDGLGFATSYPVNWWLIKRGIKEAM